MNYEGGHNEQNQKNKSWESAFIWVNTLHDKLGKGIDKNIQEAIVALTLLGINTTASCEGHLDHGTYAPYIDIQTKEINDLDQSLRQAKEKEEAEAIIEEIKRKNLEERKKLIIFLEEFYEKRQCSFECRLVVQSLARGWSRIESQGAGIQPIQTVELKKQKLEKYQKEMTDFTSFLKRKFFENYQSDTSPVPPQV